MSSSREESPDWLRSFQGPTHSTLTLSSDSEHSPNSSPLKEDRTKQEIPSPENEKNQDIILSDSDAQYPSKKTSRAKSLKKQIKVEDQKPTKKKKITSLNKRKGNVSDGVLAKEETSVEHIEPHAPDRSVWTLSSDSESCSPNSLKGDDYIQHEESSAHKNSQVPEKGKEKDAVPIDTGGKPQSNKALKEKSPKKRMKVDDQIPQKGKEISSDIIRKGNGDDVEVADEETSEKCTEPHACSSRLPLMLSEKVHRSKALVECEGESIDMSGDMGAVGRIVMSETPTGNHDMFIDLKGTIYKTTIVPSRTFCVVSFGQSEAKVEAIMNDFIQLKPQSNVYEAETMVEGTLDGFSFDSEDESDKMPKATTHQTDQNEDAEEQPDGKTKGKGKRKAEKTSGVVRKKGKSAGGKPPKKVRKKSQVPKKTKAKK